MTKKTRRRETIIAGVRITAFRAKDLFREAENVVRALFLASMEAPDEAYDYCHARWRNAELELRLLRKELFPNS